MRFSPGVPTFSPAPYHGRFSRQAVKHNLFQQQVSVRQTPNRLDCGFVQNAHRLAESFVPLEMIVKWPAEPKVTRHAPLVWNSARAGGNRAGLFFGGSFVREPDFRVPPDQLSGNPKVVFCDKV